MDLNVMLREQAVTGLQTQIDAAVVEGDQTKVRKLTDELSTLKAAMAPKAPPYGDADIRAALEAKAPWFGVDPRKSGAAVRLGKDMSPKKFATAELFADALIKAVDEELKPAAAAAATETDEEKETREAAEAEAAGEGDGEGDGEGEGEGKGAKKTRRTDGPGDLDRGTRPVVRKGPWAKLSDAPAAVATDIRRQAEKMVPKGATKEVREGFVTRALTAAYNSSQSRKGK